MARVFVLLLAAASCGAAAGAETRRWTSPEIVTSGSTNMQTVMSVARSLGVAPTAPATSKVVVTSSSSLQQQQQQQPAVTVSSSTTTAVVVPKRVCSVCSKALDMARAILIGEAASGANTGRGLPTFVKGVCGDLKVDFQLTSLSCDGIQSRFQSYYTQGQVVDMRTVVRCLFLEWSFDPCHRAAGAAAGWYPRVLDKNKEREREMRAPHTMMTAPVPCAP